MAKPWAMLASFGLHNALPIADIPRTDGEISLAHRGVLFLDELPEFDARSLEVVCQPLDNDFQIVDPSTLMRLSQFLRRIPWLLHDHGLDPMETQQAKFDIPS